MSFCPLTSSACLPYLVYRPENHAPVWPPKVPTAASSIHRDRCGHDLLLHPFCGIDLLRKTIQRSIRDSGRSQSSFPRSLMRIVPLKRSLSDLPDYADHRHHVLHGHYPGRIDQLGEADDGSTPTRKYDHRQQCHRGGTKE